MSSKYIADEISGEYKYSHFSEDNFDKFFLNDFMHYQNRDPHNGFGFGGYLDMGNEYIHNSYGYRSQEFSSEIDTVFAGDSFTYGVGLPVDAIWSSILSNKLGLESVNLGWAGASVTGIVSNLMHYFKVYGNPKNLFCMFPDLSRMQVFLNDNIMISNNGTTGGFIEVQLNHLAELKDRPPYSKKPYRIEDVVPNEIPFYYSLKAIQSLEQYCDAAGINFAWSIFYSPDHDLIKYLRDSSRNVNRYYSKFIDTNQGSWDKDSMFSDVYTGSMTDCSNEEAIYRDKYPKYFNLAGDIEQGHDMAHHGIHRHIHTANGFYDKFKGLDR